MRVRRRRYYILTEAEEAAVGTGAPQVVAHYVSVDFRSRTIEIPGGKFELTNFLLVAKAVREDLERYWAEKYWTL